MLTIAFRSMASKADVYNECMAACSGLCGCVLAQDIRPRRRSTWLGQSCAPTGRRMQQRGALAGG